MLDTDRTHQIKVQALYLFKWGTSVGVNEFVASGTPITRQVPIIAPEQLPDSLPGPRQRRPDAVLLADGSVRRSTRSRSAAARRLELEANVLNLFDQRTVNNRVTTMRRQRRDSARPAGYYTEAAFYAGQLNFDQLIAKAVAAGCDDPEPAVRDGQRLSGARSCCASA